MTLEILLSCMKQKNFSLIDKMKLNTDILIINQTNENSYSERIIKNTKQRMISNTNKGLSHSRNDLLNNMNCDIGIICDDDVVYRPNYDFIILNAFQKIKDADIIVFNINPLNYKEKFFKEIKKIRKAPQNKYYSSVQIAFKKESFYKANLWFNINFGSGSKFSSGEESLLLREARKKGLKIYEYPEIIADVDFSKSTWFKGFDEKFFYDKGAWLKAAYPKSNFIFKWYFIFKFFNINNCNLGIKEILKNINNGIRGYKKNLSFEEYNKEINK